MPSHQNEITWEFLPFNELSLESLYSIMKLRQEVFVIEQNCVYLDADGNDQISYHLLGWKELGATPLLAAYLRVLPPGVKYNEISIGRVATAPSARGKGLGKKLMEVAIDKIQTIYGKKPIRISAQEYLTNFYRELGFNTVGEIYDEDGIPHIEMIRN